MKNNTIKVLHVISLLNEEKGGLYDIVKNSCKFLKNFENIIVASNIKNKKILKDFSCKIIFINKIYKYFNFYHNLKVDLVHVYGIWSFLNTLVCFFVILKKIPLIISPQGMLEPWSLSQKFFKKKLFFLLFWKKIFQKAELIIFASEQEYKNFLKLKIKKKFNYKIIPNGFYLGVSNKKYKVYKRNKKNLLFLSRLHPKKGVSELIKVFQELKFKDWKLLIVGSGEKEYVRKLKIQAKSNLNKNILFYGFKSGQEKNDIYKKSDIFVLPSYSENFGIVVPEALSFGLPVITTTDTPWSVLKNKNCGWLINMNEKNLKSCLNSVLRSSNSKLNIMSKNAIKLSMEFHWSKISKDLNKSYSKIFNQKKFI
jgi:glycosyltransferase involved in cell wall biosynthesis